jgi:mannosyltransferase
MRRTRLLLPLAFFWLLIFSISIWPRFSLYDKSTIPSDDEPLDSPFARGCVESQEELGPRANATFMMLCRESELLQVLETVRSVEKHFNSRFHYPYVLFSDEPFSSQFQSTITKEVSSITFHIIAQEEWGFPDWIDLVRAEAAFAKMNTQGVKYGDKESYHHMCRFFSG